MELKGSKTEKNLMTAFAGESQARNKYTYFASVAKKEGYEQIAAIFLKTADNEKEMCIRDSAQTGQTSGAFLPITRWPQLRHSHTLTSLLAKTCAVSTLRSRARYRSSDVYKRQ